jgi:hypothetical protein
MATTTNYGWTTPDDTALVKDGAAAIRTLGSSVDTTTKNLNPSTTLGDIEYRSSTANTNTRLGIGTTGQVLTVAGGVPSWATASSGGMTLLSTTSLSGATTTISSIDQTYNCLQAVIYGVTNATESGNFRCAPNGSASLAVGAGSGKYGAGNFAASGLNQDRIDFTINTAPVFNNANNVYFLQIDNYANATNHKTFYSSSGYAGVSGTTSAAQIMSGSIQTNSAISSLVFSSVGGNLSTGTVLLYGVK